MENNQQIEAILNSLQSIQKAAATSFFSAKVMHQLFAGEIFVPITERWVRGIQPVRITLGG